MVEVAAAAAAVRDVAVEQEWVVVVASYEVPVESAVVVALPSERPSLDAADVERAFAVVASSSFSFWDLVAAGRLKTFVVAAAAAED